MNKKALPVAITSVRNLLRAFRGNLDRSMSRTDDEAEFMFSGFGTGISFGGHGADLYRDCRGKLLAIHGHDSHRRTLGQKTVEKLLNDSILRCLRPSKSGGVASWATFNRRVDEEVRRIRREVSRAPRVWHATIRVEGFDPRLLPLSFGGVEFVAGSTSNGAEIAAAIPDFAPARRTAKSRIEAEKRSREKTRDEVIQRFESGTLARMSIEAGDSDAASELAAAKVRAVLDVMNYFASRLRWPPRFTARAYLGPEGPRGNWAWAVHDPAAPFFSTNEERHTSFPIREFEIDTEKAKLLGVSRVSDMLQRERTDFEDRIVTALVWAGRAKVEPRRDIALLLFAIALESLLTKRDARVGVSDRLKLRAAHLIGRTIGGRRHVLASMERLYQIRSAFVHSGVSDDVSDEDVEAIRILTELACDAILSGKDFASMKTVADFDRWFDERLLQTEAQPRATPASPTRNS